MLKKYIKEIAFLSLLLAILLTYMTYNKINIQTINKPVNTVETSYNIDNSSLNGLLDDLNRIDNSYNETTLNNLSKGERGSYIDKIAERYISLINKAYSSLPNKEDEKQNSLNNIQKACDDVELSYKAAGGGSGGSTDIPYTKMKASRKEICNILKTYFGCTDDLTFKEENISNSEKTNSLENVQKDYIDINRKILGDENLAFPDVQITQTTPDNGFESAYIITSSTIIKNSGLGDVKYSPIKMKIQYKDSKYSFKYLES
ncbi:hypothetical protein FDE76_16800 [Clostridium botulinum]|uniref:Uncharacterized protein n=1 Tax=Clostridium botulinum (strain Eklund 17B / Type B) TaxID=935198 RepID=B2TMS9_CLOBB|nr:hypothetical protein CLL_A1883 [Clostridium botulinum B str. Eklund 17B (NRP)]MBY6977159.1 hypothetical protein [Clostridium botulinum]MBY6999315.1 hypothetical protein [Clostridium botulinum]MCR1272601.1 hypothetical protein [Clostridium botulinum]NFD70023.1 hypothetical protein [Clostridium botulinum]